MLNFCTSGDVTLTLSMAIRSELEQLLTSFGPLCEIFGKEDRNPRILGNLDAHVRRQCLVLSCSSLLNLINHS